MRVRILLGASLLGAPARSFADDTTVQIVVEKALEDHAECNVTSLAMYPSADEKPEKRTDINPSDFGDITLEEIRANGFGFMWVAKVQRASGVSTPAASAPAAARAPLMCDGSDHRCPRWGAAHV